MEDRDRPRARARRQPGRSHRGGRHQARGAARRPPCRNRANGSQRFRREPELGALQPGREDGRRDEPRQDGDSLGRRVGDTPRDAARPLELRAAAGLQSRRGDALHGESRRHRDRLGSHRRPQARAAVHVHARPEVLRTHDRLRRPPGEAQPRRPVDRGRPQGAGHRALGRARAHAGRGAPSRHGRRGQVARLLTGWANACGRRRHDTLTLWDVRSRSRLHGPLYAGNPSLVLAVGFSPDGATLATASSDLGLQLWDAATGDTLDDLGFGWNASDVAFSADGAMIASVRAAREARRSGTRPQARRSPRSTARRKP